MSKYLICTNDLFINLNGNIINELDVTLVNEFDFNIGMNAFVDIQADTGIGYIGFIYNYNGYPEFPFLIESVNENASLNIFTQEFKDFLATVNTNNSGIIIDLITSNVYDQRMIDEINNLTQTYPNITIRYSTGVMGSLVNNWVLDKSSTSAGTNLITEDIKTIYFTGTNELNDLSFPRDLTNGILLEELVNEYPNDFFKLPGKSNHYFLQTNILDWSTRWTTGTKFIQLLPNQIFDGNGFLIDCGNEYKGLIVTNHPTLTDFNNSPIIQNLTTIWTMMFPLSGGIIKQAQKYFIIKKCFTDTSNNNYIAEGGGGICGAQSGINGQFLIENCYSSVNMWSDAGGIVGMKSCADSTSDSIIRGCYSNGEIGGNNWDINCGGVCGTYFAINGKGTVESCYSLGILNNSCGGILGKYAAYNGTVTVSQCYSQGSLSNFSGGIVGPNCSNNEGTCNIINCYSTSLTSSTNSASICSGQINQEGNDHSNGSIDVSGCIGHVPLVGNYTNIGVPDIDNYHVDPMNDNIFDKLDNLSTDPELTGNLTLFNNSNLWTIDAIPTPRLTNFTDTSIWVDSYSLPGTTVDLYYTFISSDDRFIGPNSILLSSVNDLINSDVIEGDTYNIMDGYRILSNTTFNQDLTTLTTNEEEKREVVKTAINRLFALHGPATLFKISKDLLPFSNLLTKPTINIYPDNQVINISNTNIIEGALYLQEEEGFYVRLNDPFNNILIKTLTEGNDLSIMNEGPFDNGIHGSLEGIIGEINEGEIFYNVTEYTGSTDTLTVKYVSAGYESVFDGVRYIIGSGSGEQYEAPPCLTDSCNILTPDGYKNVANLCVGDTIVTSKGTHTQIVEIYTSTSACINKDTPYLIPAKSIDNKLPHVDTYISGNHAYKETTKSTNWILPKFTNLKQTYEKDQVKYYNIKLSDYFNDDMVCNGIIVEGWDGYKSNEPRKHKWVKVNNNWIRKISNKN
ncbi:hypothetical protein crov047 [Cafeteria roenbergensis virus]|uniref:Hedgehog/Intein (Hint) domain-containing protein n=1 Tax=Cafeteria roenbergensis virus (strain BV-PW1) TaxID=693272 RepID=E3T4G7_CROVB|nr:hypothetical protein crov047 [Cafeteria roenbergensis virus BV-PW1]ADO67080.1 hypothetical protein crov047 [Cafeteria roenbergensis virus BV-PW1]